jgi:hypothetical protein
MWELEEEWSNDTTDSSLSYKNRVHKLHHCVSKEESKLGSL